MVSASCRPVVSQVVGATPDVIAGLVTTDGAGNLTGSTDEYNGGTVTQSTIAGTYAVASSGRVAVTPTSGHSVVLYLVKQNEAFFLDTGGAVTFGFLES
jgi:hypothetical protein